MKLIGQHLLNEAAIAWANLEYAYQEGHVTYRYESGFTNRDSVQRVTKSAICVRFIDGSQLLWPVGHPDYPAVRAWLTGEEVQAVLPIEAEISAGLPSELQAMFGGRE